MHKIKKYMSLFILILFFCGCPVEVKAIPGCCSWHGGEVGCSGNKTLCADGTISSCPCDGTSSSSNGNYTNNNINTENDPAAIAIFIIGIILSFGGIFIFGYFIEFCEKINNNQKNNRRKKREIERQEMEHRFKEQKEEDIDSIIKNENHIAEINDESIWRFTSDDLVKIINSNNNNIFELIDKINDKKNGYTERDIFNNLCCKILENKKLSSLQNKCIKYLIEKRFIDNYEYIFLVTLSNHHILLTKYIMNNCNDITFNFNNNIYFNNDLKGYTEFIFESLLKINDLSLSENIFKKENFKFNIGIYLFEKNMNTMMNLNINYYLRFIIITKNQILI